MLSRGYTGNASPSLLVLKCVSPYVLHGNEIDFLCYVGRQLSGCKARRRPDRCGTHIHNLYMLAYF